MHGNGSRDTHSQACPESFWGRRCLLSTMARNSSWAFLDAGIHSKMKRRHSLKYIWPHGARTSSPSCSNLGNDEGQTFIFAVERNLDLRKGVHLVELAIFRDDAALQAFRAHPEHTKITDVLREIADWQVGDFVHPHIS